MSDTPPTDAEAQAAFDEVLAAEAERAFAGDVRPLVLDEAPCDWCSELAPLREWTHEGGEVEDLCPRCYRAAANQRESERGV